MCPSYAVTPCAVLNFPGSSPLPNVAVEKENGGESIIDSGWEQETRDEVSYDGSVVNTQQHNEYTRTRAECENVQKALVS